MLNTVIIGIGALAAGVVAGYEIATHKQAIHAIEARAIDFEKHALDSLSRVESKIERHKHDAE